MKNAQFSLEEHRHVSRERSEIRDCLKFGENFQNKRANFTRKTFASLQVSSNVAWDITG